MPASALPKVTILMACYQGAAHLEAQLASIAAQRGVDWDLWASDDGSTDATRDILAAFHAAHPGRVRLLAGPGQGAAAHFLALLCHPELPVGPVALSDQDDIWYPSKLEQALSCLDGVRGAAIYSARSRHVSEDGQPLGESRQHRGAPSFANAQVENRISGHAAVLNAEALALVRRVGPVNVPFHDWWLYQLLTGAGGTVIHDPSVVLDYRQHRRNVLGAPRNLRARLLRIARVLGPHGPRMMQANRTALRQAAPHLTAGARALLRELDRTPRGLARNRLLARLGVKRDEPAAQTVLHLAALLGRA